MSDPISDFADLPDHESILTADGGPLDLRTAAQRAKQAVLLLRPSAQKSVAVLSTRDATGLETVTLREDVRKAGFHIAQTYVVVPQILIDLDAASFRSHQSESVYDEHSAVQTFDGWLAEALRRKVTDIHIEIRERVAAVRMRENGILVSLPAEESGKAGRAVAAAFTLLADSDTRNDPSFSFTEERNCIIERVIGEDTRRYRFESFPVLGGLDCIIRVLHLADPIKVMTLDELGYAASQIVVIKRAARRRVGLILVSGSTGSGKTTTLLTLMTLDPERDQKKFFALDDPTEYRMAGVSHISIRGSGSSAAGAAAREHAYTEAARMILRADPDAAMIGEVRGEDVGNVLTALVQTGHRCYSSLHTTSAIGSIPRLESSAIAIARQTSCARDFLSLLMYQVLLPRLCDCARPAAELLSPEYLQNIKDIFRVDDLSRVRAAKPGGCEKCRETGVGGQTVAAEVVAPTATLLRLLRDGQDAEADEYWRGLRVAGFGEADMTGKTAFEHGLWKVLQGQVDPRHLEREFQEFDDYAMTMPTMGFGNPSLGGAP